MLTISTRLASPAHAGSRLLAVIGAAEGFPAEEDNPEHDQHRTRDKGPDDQTTAGQAGDALGPREETQTPVQYTTTITIAVHTPLEASSGLIT